MNEDLIFKATIATLGIISSVLCLFVVLTYSVFEEKRKSSTSKLIFFQAIVTTGLDVALIMACFKFEDEGYDQSLLCDIQAAVFLFCGNCLQISWLLITINLFRRVHLDLDEIKSSYLISLTCLASTLATLVPFFLPGNVIRLDRYWCFISSDNVVVIYSCFYLILILISLVGTPLWFLIIRKIKKSMDLEKKARAMNQSRSQSYQNTGGQFSFQSAPYATAAASSSSPTSSSTTPINDQKLIYTESTKVVTYEAKKSLLARQTAYLTGFLIIFYVMLLNRLAINILKLDDQDNFIGWIIHGIAIAVCGIFIFSVFGATQRNWDLWKSIRKPFRNIPSESVRISNNYQSL